MPSKDNRGLLIVEPPSQVRFNGPFTRPVVTTLTLINPTDNKIIFKIKTTAPSFYGVRPNFGVVQPRNFTEVEIARQPFNYDQGEKINHKFMVQSLMVPTNVEDLNKVWENADATQLNATKLRCVFEMPTGKSQEASFLPSAIKKPQTQSPPIMSNEKVTPEGALSPRNETSFRELPPHMPKTILKNTSQVLAGTHEKGSDPMQPISPELSFESSAGPVILALQESPINQSVQTNRYISEEPAATNVQPANRPQINQTDSNYSFTKNQLNALNKEMHQLYKENSLLRKENNILKDEIDHVRTTPTRRENIMPFSLNGDGYDPAAPVPYTYMLTSVTIAVISIFLGKYIL